MRGLLTLLFFCLGLTSVQASTLQVKAQRYADTVHYDVFRNDEPVGAYSLSFEPSGDALKVAVEMKIATRIFGLFSYDYLYQATEVWQSDSLESLEVRMLTNGDEEAVTAVRQGDRLQVVDPKGRERLLPASLLTTHHWLDDILNQPEVLNTINGKASKLSVKEEQQAVWMIEERPVAIRGFRLGGDLENTLSWYDSEGRWRGMSFKAKDGSTIDVRWKGAETTRG